MDAHPRASKYSARVDSSDTNTSHGLVLQLVGSDKRVLDVGCASGYLAEALVAQGNKVSGVELDADDAEKARPFLDRLVVGNVEDLDLVDEFGPGEFDVLVFADVLEHVKDPVDVLRRARGLLADGGYAVLSIPNVAHGSVRLALLHGRFEYRPLGLLDDTHLRFFTRSSLQDMVLEAGFVAVDLRQTTAGPFETEIPVARSDYPDEVVAEVEADPDSRIYQFVARVEPADAGGSALGQILTERNRELHSLRQTLADIARLAGGGPSHPVVGVLDAGGDDELVALRTLRVDVARMELRRRLAGFEIRAFSLAPDVAEPGTGPDGIQPLGPWSPARAADLRSQLDALVVLPRVGPEGEQAVADLVEAGVAVHRMPAHVTEVDILALADRLVGADVPAQRAEYLRVSGLLPVDRPHVITAPDAPSPSRKGKGQPVSIQPAPSISALDLMGLLASARAVESSDVGLQTLAAALGRSDPTTRVELAGRADFQFDELYTAVIGDAGRRLAGTVPQRLAELQERVATLEAVNAGLAGALGRERYAMAAEVARLRSAPGLETRGRPNPVQVQRLSSDLDRTAAEKANLEAEIGRIYATKTMRTAAPARRLYGRFRSRRS